MLIGAVAVKDSAIADAWRMRAMQGPDRPLLEQAANSEKAVAGKWF
jgi:hypothetical protein